MRCLSRKLARDAWRQRSQLLAIALVMSCGVALFVTMRSMHTYLRGRQAAYYASARFAGEFATLVRAPLAVAARIARMPEVQGLEARVVATAVADLPGLPEPGTVQLVSLPEGRPPELNDLVVQQGRLPGAAERGEVLASAAFARANGLAPGDSLGVILQGHWEWLRIVGTAISPEFVYEIPPGGGALFPDNQRFGILWMPYRPLAAAFDLAGAFNDLVFTLRPGADAIRVRREVDRLLAPYGGRGTYPRRDQVSHQFLDSEVAETRVTSVLLPVIFLGVTAFLLHTVLARLVATEREQIAVLKAFGFPNGRIAAHYLAFALVPVAAGTLLGGVVGLWGARSLAAVYARFYQFPAAPFRADATVLLAAVAVAGGAALVGALGAVRRVARLPPAEAMRPERPAAFRQGLLDRAGVVGALPLPVRSIARGLQRMPGRAVLTVLGLALAVALTLAGRFMFDAIDALKALSFVHAARQDVSVTFDAPRDLEVREELARLPGVRRVELLRDVPVRLGAGAGSVRTVLQGLPRDATLRRVVDGAGAAHPVREGGLLLTATLARRLGIRPGARVRIEVLEGRRPVRDIPVAGVVEEMLGSGAYASLGAVAALLGEAPTVTTALLTVAPADRAELNGRLRRLPGVAGVAWRDAALAGFERTVATSFRISIVTLVLFAVIIAIGVVYNAARVALAERTRELASLRVLGFTRREVATMLLGEQGFLLAVALPCGLLLGWGLAWLVVTRFSSDLFRLPLVVSTRSQAFAVGVVLCAGGWAGAGIWRRIQRLDLVAALKTRE